MAGSTRTDIAAALSGVDGIAGQPYTPRTPVAGMGWPVWVSVAPYTNLGWRYEWDVFVTAPGTDMTAAEMYAEAHLDAIADALTAIAEVVTCEPVLITSGEAAGLPAIRVRISTV